MTNREEIIDCIRVALTWEFQRQRDACHAQRLEWEHVIDIAKVAGLDPIVDMTAVAEEALRTIEENAKQITWYGASALTPECGG